MSVQPRRTRAHRDPGLHGELTELLEPVIGEAGYDLEDVVVTPAGKRRLVRVIVDGDGGVSLDGLAEVSRGVSAALDAADAVISGPYVLEVTSPGVDRPLTEPRHWRRARGRIVRAPLIEGGEIEGRVSTADDEGVVIETSAGHSRHPYAELGHGRVQVEFRRGQSDQGGSANGH